MNELYTFTIPIFTKSLGALKAILSKGEAYATEKGIDAKTLIEARLASDMLPLAKQVQIACDNAKGAAARLSGTEAPRYEDTETTFAELQARVDKTLAFLQTITPESFSDSAEKHIVLPYFSEKYMLGFDYVREYALPNFFFHLATAYDILRNQGVQLGKSDYTGQLPFKD